jgi:hypothetical protein
VRHVNAKSFESPPTQLTVNQAAGVTVHAAAAAAAAVQPAKVSDLMQFALVFTSYDRIQQNDFVQQQSVSFHHLPARFPACRHGLSTGTSSPQTQAARNAPPPLQSLTSVCALCVSANFNAWGMLRGHGDKNPHMHLKHGSGQEMFHGPAQLAADLH